MLHSFSAFSRQDQSGEFLQYLISYDLLALRREKEKKHQFALLHCQDLILGLLCPY